MGGLILILSFEAALEFAMEGSSCINSEMIRDLLQTVDEAVEAIPELESLRDDWLRSAFGYAQKRVEWWAARRWAPDAFNDVDRERTRHHDGFIANCEALARNMRKAGFETPWYDNIRNDRKAIGDLACRIHFEIAIAAR